MNEDKWHEDIATIEALTELQHRCEHCNGARPSYSRLCPRCERELWERSDDWQVYCLDD